MSAGIMLSEAISNVLRPSYSKGDLAVTVQYLVEGLKIGEYRLMLKKDFDTACWVPPVGKRGSHSIYYGDRMLTRVIEHFVDKNSIKMPTDADFALEVKAELAKEKSLIKSRTTLSPKKKKFSSENSAILNKKADWLKENLTSEQYGDLEEMLVAAVASYGRHEREHARQTTQDLKTVNKDLRVLGIPFIYFNLFEDARIEHRSREELGSKFNWLALEDMGPLNNPFNIFLRCIKMEGAPDLAAYSDESAYKPRPHLTVGHIAKSVANYYQRACACTTSEQLYPIIVEFLAEFRDDMPPEKPNPSKDSGNSDEQSAGDSSDSSDSGRSKSKSDKSSKPKDKADDSADTSDTAADDADEDSPGEQAGDLSTAAEAAEKGDEFFEDFESDTEVVGGTDAEGKKAEAKAKAATSSKVSEKGMRAKGVPDSIGEVESGGMAKESDFLAKGAGALDDTYKKRVEDLTALLMRMFKTHTLSQATESLGGHRISSRHIARGELRFIQRKVYGGKGKRKYSIVYDCSGSMSGQPDREGKLFLLALNNLAKRGYLEGNLILSGWVRNKPGWLSYQFPVKDDIILRISTHHSSEGLQAALADNLKKITAQDDVFIYTDAQICDTPIKRELFAAKRVWPVGLYVGDESDASEMARHFPQNIIRNSIEEIAQVLLTRNKRAVS